MKYSAIIFDLDGTLLDTSEGIVNGVKFVAEKMGLRPISYQQMLKFIGPPVLESFQREFGVTIEVARNAVELYRDRYSRIGLYEASKYQGIEIVLEKLLIKNIKTGVATLKRDDFAKSILAHFEIGKYFNCIKGIDKNDIQSKAALIKSCIHELGLSNDAKVLYVGDSEYDAHGAKEAGIDFLGVTYGYGFRTFEDVIKFKPVTVCGSVLQLDNYLCNVLDKVD